MCCYSFSILGQSAEFTSREKKWADSVLRTLSLDERIAQMMMVPAWSNQGAAHIAQIENLVSNYKVGGIIFFQGDPMTQAYQTNYYQQLSKIPLFISMDAEWGLSMRIKNLDKFPFAMTLGAGATDSQIYQTAYQMGLECKRMGVNMSYSPVADVNTNPNNPIIGFRSFGQDPKEVARCVKWFTKGMQDAGIIACAKHFPGHGDSEMDSHNTLPMINHTKARLDSVELLPFREAIKSGVDAIMVAHLDVPALEKGPRKPSSLSPKIINGLLKDSMGFKGLVITDAMNMQGISKFYAPGIAEAEAVVAGNDILCLPYDVPYAISTIKKYIKKGRIDSQMINKAAYKILLFKAHLNLYETPVIKTENLYADLWAINDANLKQEEANKTVVVAANKKSLLPINTDNYFKAAHWRIGNSDANDLFTKNIGKSIGLFQYQNALDAETVNFKLKATEILGTSKNIIVSIHSNKIWGNRSVTLPQDLRKALEYLDTNCNLIVCVFGNFYLLRDLNKINTVIIGSEDQPEWHAKVWEVILGKSQPNGHLPVTAGNAFLLNQSVALKPIESNNIPIKDVIELGFKKEFANKIDAVMAQCINSKAAPGGQVLVLKNGHTAFHKSYGHFTYETSSSKVLLNDMYDLASVSKMAGTTLAAMKLYETGKLNLDSAIGFYLPELLSSNKGCLTSRELLLHEAGLVSWIPFYKKAVMQGNVYSTVSDSIHTMRIANNCYMNPTYKDSIWKQILESPLGNKGQYLYSDLSMILMQRVIEKITKTNLDVYLENNFYKPLGLLRTGYNPAINKEQWICAPTNNDQVFRNGLVQGFVHDPAAAMLGGVSGHAGLFSNSMELGIIMQMLANGGVYKGTQYFKAATINYFSAKQNTHSHRGLGFDKPYINKGVANVSKLVPDEMFGHSGFTGTWAWSDPINNIVVIVLTNRTYPTDNNKRLIELSIRGQIIDAVYGSL